MNKATAQNCTKHSEQHYITEASMLGLRPGEWPREVETDLGNGLPAILYGTTNDGTHIYVQPGTFLRITVLND
jgi:hypothetical protein